MPPAERVAVAAPSLKDPTRAVRIEAARVLAAVPSDRFDASQRKAFDAAAAEFVEAQLSMADMPASHLNLAVFYASQGKGPRRGRIPDGARMDPSARRGRTS
jgi:hypothetical protein